MPPQFSIEDSLLITELHALERKSPKLVKSHLYPAPNEPNTLVCSWKLNEFKYYDIPSPFPTLARGLFSTKISSEGEKSTRYRIVVRGYDKFFNIGEVPWTTWEALEAHTAPPYTLSLKSNGCIIFIAALSPTKIIVTSKHSVGPVAGVDVSHAQAGEQWLRRYLEEKEKTEADFAGRLWEENWTAVAELCDDSFEEHVLPYSPEKTGLHLHGLNVATKSFITMPHDTVDAFAEEWGFIKTRTHIVNTIAEVREFTSRVAEVGEWEGEAVEGFVVRTHVTEPPTEGRGKRQASKDQSPYAPGSSFFFKVKFDEPYMMYRDWREATKKLLTTKGPLSPSIIPKGRMKRKETQVYVKWVIEEIKKNRKAFDGYTNNHGIIATRERFLAWRDAQKEKGELKEEDLEGVVDKEKIQKAIIVPVAIPGSGKTSVAVALTHLFGFGHTQSDDIVAKKAAPMFIKNVLKLLQNHSVVIADKNNHLELHRQQLRDAVAGYTPPVHLIGLNWSIEDKPPAVVHRICADRVLTRGTNHQTLTADTSHNLSHESVIWSFIKDSEGLTEQEVDACVDIEIEDDLETMVRSVVNGLWKILGGPGGLLGEEEPNDERIAQALEEVANYKAKRTKAHEAKEAKVKKAAEKPPRYFGILPDLAVTQVLDGVFAGDAEAEGKMKDGTEFWEKLKKGKRVTVRPHITIVHEKLLPLEQTLWDKCVDVSALPSPPLFECTMRRVLWNGRIMVFPVENLELPPDSAKEGKELLEVLPKETRNRLHITVGTANGSVPPVEGGPLVEEWRKGKGEEDGVYNVELVEEIVVTGKLKGLVS